MPTSRRLRPVALPLLLALALLTPFALNAEEDAQKDQPDLQQIMEDAGKHFSALRKIVAKTDQTDQALEHTHQLQTLMLAAKPLTPEKANSPAKALAYRRQLAVTTRELCNLEIALLDGDTEKAKETFRKIGALQRAGHNQFK